MSVEVSDNDSEEITGASITSKERSEKVTESSEQMTSDSNTSSRQTLRHRSTSVSETKEELPSRRIKTNPLVISTIEHNIRQTSEGSWWGGFLSVQSSAKGKFRRMFVVVNDEQISFCKSIESKTEPEFVISLLYCKIIPSDSTKFFSFSVISMEHSVTISAPEGNVISRARYNHFNTLRTRAINVYRGVETKQEIDENIANLLSIEGNTECADCGDLNVEFVVVPHCVFVCISCSGVHRMFGAEFSRGYSLKHDSIPDSTYERLLSKGNRRVNKIYEPNLNEPKPNSESSRGDRERFIYNKYVLKKYANPKKLHLLPSVNDVNIASFLAQTVSNDLRDSDQRKETENSILSPRKTPLLVRKEREKEIRIDKAELKSMFLQLLRDDPLFREEIRELVLVERKNRHSYNSVSRKSSKKSLSFNLNDGDRRHVPIPHKSTDLLPNLRDKETL